MVERLATRPERPWLTLVLLAALCVSAWQVQAGLPLNHDVGWLLIGARRLLEAGRLSAHRFVDVTPPLIVGLYALPVAAAKALGASEIGALRIFVIGLAAGSLRLCQLAASRLLAGEPSALLRTWLVAVAVPLLPLVGYDFAQREHLITLLLLPYLVDAAARAQAAAPPRSVALWIGAAAGLAIGMKPQFALVVLAAEALVWRAQRRLLPGAELGALTAALALSAGWTAWAAPDYLRVTLPLVWDTYAAYRAPLPELVRWFDPLLAAALIAVAWRLPRGGALRALAHTFGVASAAAYAAYLAAGTGWGYHRHPFGVFAIAALAPALLRPLSRGPITALAVFLVTAASLLVAPLEIHDVKLEGGQWAGWSQGAASLEILRAAETRGRGGPVFVFSSSVAPAFPAVNYAGVEWASRFSCLWPLPAVIRARAQPEGAVPEARRQRLEAVARYLVDAVTDDLERGRPDLVFVPRAPEPQAFGGIDFDFLAFFQRDPRFAGLWAGYAPLEDTPSFRIYRLRQP